MSMRNRTSTARPTPGRMSVNLNTDTALPEYEKPNHPLNQKAQRELSALYSNRRQGTIKRLKENHIKMQNMIAEAAGKINDQVKEREQTVLKRKARREKQGAGPEDEEKSGERELEALRAKVADMTQKLEESMRSVVDGEMSVDRTEEALAWLKDNAAGHAAREYETQMSQRQTQQNRRRTQQGEDGEEDPGSSPEPTPIAAQNSIELTGPIELYEKRLEASKQKYLALSLGTRYAKNNAYITFKRMVHDAQHGDDGPPLPRPETWFTEGGQPAPGITATQNREGNDSDDDIAIERETVSTRCPITLQEFREPFTSTKCPHSFEKDAIMEMIRRSMMKTGPRNDRVVQCPVTGCEQMLSANDLRSDPILVRKIRRIQAANAQGSDEEGSDADEDMDGDTTMNDAPRRRQSETVVPDSQQPRTQQPPRSSMIIDMGDPSDDDEEEE